MITHIFWDFNGTILDDIDASVAAVNCMLKTRNLPPTDKDTYRNELSLPLENYYRKLGIANPQISELSVEFRAYLKENSRLIKIFDNFYSVINSATALNISNVLISSLYKKHLKEEVYHYNIENYFEDIIGMDDLNVGTKTDIASKYIKAKGIIPKNILFIGDLTTDAIMAKELGAQCILIPNGHCSKERCINQGVLVYDSLNEVKEYLLRA